jgi:hypothetical protein
LRSLDVLTSQFLRWSFIYHYRNRRLCRVPEALGKALKTLGKLFV